MPFGGLLTAGVIAGGSLGSAYLNSRKQQAGPGVSPTNPGFATLNNLFGTKLVQHKHGSDAGQTSLVGDKKNPGIFGGLGSSVSNYMNNPIPVSGAEQNLIGGLTGGAQDSIAKTLETFNRTLGQSQQLFGQLGSGQQTDATPLYQTAISQFQRNALPEIAERVGAGSGGIQSQGFIDSSGRVAQNLLDEAARQNVLLSESAKNRQFQERGLQANLLDAQQRGATAQLALPAAYASDLVNLNQTLRSEQEAQRRRPLDVFSQLNGLGAPSQQGFFVNGSNPQGNGTAQTLGSLASSLPPFLGGGAGGGGTGGGLGGLGDLGTILNLAAMLG